MLAPFLAAWVISPPPTPRTLGDGALELRLPESAEGCGQPLPQLRRGDAVVSIYDYGDGALAPGSGERPLCGRAGCGTPAAR